MLVLFTASYFVNWSYQNSKACTVLVGESTEMFPASKATTLESSNKSLASRPHPSSTAGSGKGDHSRPRRSVDGHASVPSVSSTDSSTVDMHELITTPTVNTVSLVHGVASASENQGIPEEEGGKVKASVPSGVDNPVNIGVLTNEATLETSSYNNGPLEDQSASETTSTTGVSTTAATTSQTVVITSSFTTPKAVYSGHPEHPPEVVTTEKHSAEKSKTNKDNIAYDPEDMQGDAFPSIYSYGVQKLQYLKLLTRLNEVSEELHIYSNASAENDNSVEKFHYDTVKTTPKNVATTIPPVLKTTIPVTTTISPVTTEKTTTERVFVTTNKFFAPTEHAALTTPPASETNNSNTVNNTHTSTEDVVIENATVNIAAESKTPEVTSNAKHVLINLTISSDSEENSLYKPLYSLTVKVPTVGDSNEIPTVKITPMDVEPTQPTHFNKPVTIEGTTKRNEEIDKKSEWGGSCECSCPVCEDGNSADSFYDDEYSNTTNSPTDKTGNKEQSTTNNGFANTTELGTSDVATDTSESSGITTEIEYETVTDESIFTTDYTTETEPDFPTTAVPKCICPKVKIPPILILEGEVTEFEFDK